MIISNDKIYIIKQSNDSTFKFTYEKNVGIVYQILTDNIWSESIIVFKTLLKNFCILLLPNDKIYLFCQSSQGHIILCIYENGNWESNIILKSKNDSIQEIYFDALLYKNEINVVYSIPDEKAKHSALFHQIVNSDAEFSPAKMIDIITNSFIVPFMLNSDGTNLYLAYQTLKQEYLLGYKVLLDSSNSWSSFIVLDNSPLPYNDYSIISSNLNIHYIYVKNIDSKCEINYYNRESKEVKSLHKDEKILCCSMFILDDILWILWISQDKIWGYFSKNNGKTFEVQPYYKDISSLNISKAIYQSNVKEDIEHIILKEAFITNTSKLDILVLGNLYNIKSEKEMFLKELSIIDNSKELSDYKVNIKTYLDKTYEKLSYYERKISQKDALISQLNDMLKTQRSDFQMLRKKHSLLEINTKKFKEDLNELNSTLNYKEKEIELFKNNSSQYEDELLICKNKLKVIEKLSKEQLNTISGLQTKIIDYETELIQNHKKLETDKAEITLLKIKSTEKDNVINTFEKQIEELSAANKSYENQSLLQSEKIIYYLEKIQSLQDCIKTLEANLEEANINANSSILKRIFRT
jgi:hypothetical protein